MSVFFFFFRRIMHYSASFLCLLLRTIILSAPALRPRYSVRRRPFFDGAVFGAVAVRERRPPHSARQGPGVAQNRRAHGGASERVPPVVRARARAKPPECTTRAEKPNVNFIRLTCTLRSDTLQVRGRAGSALRAAQRPLRRHRQTRHFEVKKRRAVFAC